LSYGALGFARLNGITDDSALALDMSLSIDTQGLLLASIIIGALGVLDDVTVTQAVTVAELAHANPSYGFARLYRAAGRIGRAHIASVINTIILAYAGASLPLLLLFSIGNQPLGDVMTTPVIAQEIVRSIVGTLGLIAAVPITTALAALTASRHRSEPAVEDDNEPAPRRARGAALVPRRARGESLVPRRGRRDELASGQDDDFFAPHTDHDDDFFAPASPGPRDGVTAPHVPPGGGTDFFTPQPRPEDPPHREPPPERPARHRRRTGA
ncbi:YibE/F family protein, partial [Nonomuraea sp. KM90]|uniref:YibE/F family protein n=1 Tax=Nonomuraea sp. KM90 TaxID=3457428 RepID=UPI003FCD917A